MADIDKTVVLDSKTEPCDKELCVICKCELQPDPNDSTFLRCPVCNFKKKIENTLVPGSIVGNKYKLLCYLNSGGCGDLFICCPVEDLAKRYVLKVMKKAGSTSQARFQREAMILSSIRNERIAAVYDFWESGNRSYIVMEYISGKNLREVQDSFEIGEETALQIVQEVAYALQFIWENYAIIHRDIKPENIMITDEYQVKLLDFGLSKQVTSSGEHDVTTERVGLGTPGYMSPEQFVDSKNVDFKSDIFSLGATLFFLITGEKPITGKSHSEVYSCTCRNSPPPKSRLEGKCSSQCIDLIQFLMQRDPKDRPESYGILLEKLTALIS